MKAVGICGSDVHYLKVKTNQLSLFKIERQKNSSIKCLQKCLTDSL